MSLKISIITPNFNYVRYIGELIESVISQNYNNYEYIVVDDGSTDQSVEKIQKYVKKYPKQIKLIQQENKGQTAAINVGLRIASGDIIGWINSDDTYCSDTFQKVIEAFEKHPETDIVFGDMNAMDLNGNFIYRRRHLKFHYTTGCFLGFATILSSNAVFWRKSAMQKNGLPKESLLCNMDGEFYSRLTKGMKMMRIKSPLANFRKQPFTKAAENNSNWNKIVEQEVNLELQNSYLRLKISKVLPYSYGKYLKYFFRLNRVLFRMVSLHFIKQHKEQRDYNKRENLNA